MATRNTKKKKPSRQANQHSWSIGPLISKSLFVLIAMAWAFILGVLVGKGYRPENAIPEIARIMPEKQEVTPPPPKVLKAEELGYYDRLKKAPPPSPGAGTPNKARKKTTVQSRKPVAQPTQRFAYIYQAAAFRSQADAFRLQQQIIGLGIPAFIETTSSGWYRVNVRFKGTPSQTNELKARLNPLGVTRLLLKSKHPI